MGIQSSCLPRTCLLCYPLSLLLLWRKNSYPQQVRLCRPYRQRKDGSRSGQLNNSSTFWTECKRCNTWIQQKKSGWGTKRLFAFPTIQFIVYDPIDFSRHIDLCPALNGAAQNNWKWLLLFFILVLSIAHCLHCAFSSQLSHSGKTMTLPWSSWDLFSVHKLYFVWFSS